MKNKKSGKLSREDGFSSIQTMLILFALSLTVLGLGSGISLTQGYYLKNEAVKRDLVILKAEVTEIMKQLGNDPTPDSDSYIDPVWSYVESRADQYEYIKLEDISSRINPNWVRSAFFERTELKKFLLSGVSPDMFREYRDEQGYMLDIYSGYSRLIDPDALDTLFTPYSYLNVNTAYEYVLKDIYELITGDSAGAEAFHTFISNLLAGKHIITEEELQNAAGSDSVYPVISTLPEMNIHFIPEFILKQVLSYPYGGEFIENNNSISNTIFLLRLTNEITPEELHGLIKTEDLQERVFDHLGTKTWFWRVSVSSGRSAVEAIIVCIPDGVDYSYRLYSFSSLL